MLAGKAWVLTSVLDTWARRVADSGFSGNQKQLSVVIGTGLADLKKFCERVLALDKKC